MKDGKLIVIGAGPAGVSAALYARRGGAGVTVLHNGPGALGKAEKIENFYGQKKPVSGAELYATGLEQLAALDIKTETLEVTGLEFNETGGFTALSGDKRFTADALVLALGGKRAVPKIASITEFEGKGVSYCAVCDGFFYRGRRTAVLGSGSYALSEAMHLKPVAGSVTILTDGQPPEADFSGFQVRSEKVAAVRGEQRLSEAVFKDGSVLGIDGLFIAAGSAGAADLALKLGAVLAGPYISVDETMASSIPGVFAAGDCTGGLLQIAKAVHDGAAAGMSALKYLRSL